MIYTLAQMRSYQSDGPVVRASASQLEGCGFEPWPSHTNNFEHCYHCLLARHLMYENGVGEVKHAELPVDQAPTVAFIVFTDMWPWATGNGDRCHPVPLVQEELWLFLTDEVKAD